MTVDNLSCWAVHQNLNGCVCACAEGMVHPLERGEEEGGREEGREIGGEGERRGREEEGERRGGREEGRGRGGGMVHVYIITSNRPLNMPMVTG